MAGGDLTFVRAAASIEEGSPRGSGSRARGVGRGVAMAREVDDAQLSELRARCAALEEDLAAAKGSQARDAAQLAELRAQSEEDLATIEQLRRDAGESRLKYMKQQAEHIRALAGAQRGDGGAAVLRALAERDEAHAAALAGAAREAAAALERQLAAQRRALVAERAADAAASTKRHEKQLAAQRRKHDLELATASSGQGAEATAREVGLAVRRAVAERDAAHAADRAGKG